MLRLGCLVLVAGFACSGSVASAQQAANPFESVGDQNSQRAENPLSEQSVLPVAQNRQANSVVDGDAIMIGAINIDSELPIAADRLASGYEQYIGQSATQDVLKSLANSVSEMARQEGYIFASAFIPPQSVEVGVVKVRLDPGAIDEVRIIGSRNKKLRRILLKLKCEAAQSELVEQQLLLAGDLPDITVRNTTYLREEGRGVLVVTVREQKARGYAALDNYGPDALGPVRARLQLDIAGLLTDSDVLTANVITTLAQPKELSFVNLKYATTLGDGDTVVGFSVSAGRTRSGGRLRSLDFTGRSRFASVFASQSLKRSNDFNLWLNAELAYLEVEQSQDGVRFQDDRIATAALNFTGNHKISFGHIYGGIGVTQGLGILGASRRGDPLNSRVNGSGEFTKANAWVNAILDFGHGFGARIAGNGQIASRPLLSANEIAIGGPYFGRGYDFSERFGDEGIMGLAELRKGFDNVANWLDWVQLYGFVDGGYVSNIGTGFGDGSLSSAGGGIRTQMGPVDFNIETAMPINEDRFESADRSPKINVQVGVRF